MKAFLSLLLLLGSPNSIQSLSQSLYNVVRSSGVETSDWGSCPFDEGAIGGCVINSPYNVEQVLRCYLSSKLSCEEKCKVSIPRLEKCEEKTKGENFMVAAKLMDCFLSTECTRPKRGNFGTYVNSGEARADRSTWLDKIEAKFG